MRVRTLYDQKNFCDLFLINYNCVWKDAKLGITIVCSFISTKVRDGIFLFPIDSCKIYRNMLQKFILVYQYQILKILHKVNQL